MPKLAQDFLLDTQLGEKKYTLESSKISGDKGGITLDIEGATPVSLLKQTSTQRKPFLLFTRVDTWLKSIGGVQARDLSTFFRLLAVMINAGIPLIKSLEVISEQIINARLKKAVEEIRTGLETGQTLSGGMSHFPKVFAESQVGMIRSGEASGHLNQILLQLATDVEKLASMKKKIKGALLYPAFVLIVLAGVITAMLIFVVPKIADIFKDTGQQLPLLTRIVIAASDWLRFNKIELGIILAMIIIGFILFKKTKFGKYTIDRFMLMIPLIGPLLKKSILARFARSLQNLLMSGIPIIESIMINSKGIGNELYRERLILSAEDLSRGIPLGESLRDTPLFPQLMVQMIQVGEKTAELDSICGKVAEYYEEEVDVAVSSLTKALEPIMIVCVGGVVGAIVAAVMLPIIQLVSLSEAL